jgi:hypothetical protein
MSLWLAGYPKTPGFDVRFSNRPAEVKRFQAIHDCGVGITRGLVLLFGLGARPFHHGIRGQGGTIFGATLPDGRSKQLLWEHMKHPSRSYEIWAMSKAKIWFLTYGEQTATFRSFRGLLLSLWRFDPTPFWPLQHRQCRQLSMRHRRSQS